MARKETCCSPDCYEAQEQGPRDNTVMLPDLRKPSTGRAQKVETTLNFKDTLGALSVRLGINRDNYKVSPGLYAVGNPDDKCPVLVTANYKLTFDCLRAELTNHNLWILVLDTKGINVWCAAGKGTFGTEELSRKIDLVNLQSIVSHRTIILPQLGAPGVAAFEVKKNTGFKVRYGPVRATDIPEFLKNNLQATKKMRKVEFTLMDRLKVIPVEFKQVLKMVPIIFILLFIFNLFNPDGIGLAEAGIQSLYNLVPYAGAVALGTIGVAALLPYIPFRGLALKGLVLGLGWAAVAARYSTAFYFPESGLITAANTLLLTAITTFLSLNFTGSTTYTSLSGVEKETLYTIPGIALACVLALGLIITHKVLIFAG